jgi:hypothetical protein
MAAGSAALASVPVCRGRGPLILFTRTGVNVRGFTCRLNKALKMIYFGWQILATSNKHLFTARQNSAAETEDTTH